MTAAVLISGELFGDPARKTSQSGKTYTKATIKTLGADNTPEYWNVLSFSETASAELMELHAGERLAVQGQLKLDLYNGKISRTVFVSAVLTLRQKRKRKEQPKAPRPATNRSRISMIRFRFDRVVQK